jgi:hypothetical protein
LTYFALIFGLTPLQISTGLAMSPALAGRFPWFPRLFGGRQAARSLHFLGLMAFVAFTVHHIALVIAHGVGNGVAAIVLGVAAPTVAQRAVAVAIALTFLGALISLHVWATRRSLQEPRAMQDALQRVVDPVQARLLQPLASRQPTHESGLPRNRARTAVRRVTIDTANSSNAASMAGDSKSAAWWSGGFH